MRRVRPLRPCPPATRLATTNPLERQPPVRFGRSPGRAGAPTWTPGFPADRIPPDMRRVPRASGEICAASRRQRPLPTDPRRDTVHPMMQQQ